MEHLSQINDDRKNLVANIMREVNKNFEKREIKRFRLLELDKGVFYISFIIPFL